jgi:signal transduction histidine kinase
MSDRLIQYFSLLYDSLRFPVQVIDESGCVVYVNNEFSVQWGYSLAELKEYVFFKDPELRRNGIIQIVKNTLENKTYSSVDNYSDTLLINRHTAIPLLRTSIIPVAFENKNYVVLLHEDQTEMVLAEKEIQKSRDANKEAERLKNTFLNVLSHELRTPLNIILGYATIIKENLKDKITNEEKVYLDNLYSGSERLFKSITQMLEFAQIEAGNYQLNIETFDLVNIFKHCIVPYKNLAEAKKLDFKTNFEEKNIFVEIDLQCTENVINNLLDNAVKFTQQGFVDIEVGLLKERDLAVCKIKDTGIGISTEYLDHLYHPFSQEDLDIGRNFEGNGLGLALAKRFIEKMGGSLVVDSIKSVGTTFTFTLPLSKNKTLKDRKYVSESNGSAKILMLDDSGESFELLKAFLKGSYQIKVYNYKGFSPNVLNEDDFRVIIMDITKNYWDRGLDLCKKLKVDNAGKIPLMVLSSEFMFDKIQQFYNAGADEFLVKPFAKKDLISLLEKITSK